MRFRELDGNLPIMTVMGVGNEDCVVAVECRVRSFFAAKSDLVSSVRIWGGDMGKKSNFKDELEIQVGIKLF